MADHFVHQSCNISLVFFFVFRKPLRKDYFRCIVSARQWWARYVKRTLEVLNTPPGGVQTRQSLRGYKKKALSLNLATGGFECSVSNGI